MNQTDFDFESFYTDRVDPWDFEGDQVERGRLDLLGSLVADLGPHHRAFEPGCGEGALTRRLVRSCARVTAYDTSTTAIQRAAGVLPETVEVHVGTIPGSWPDGEFDLMMLSEILYYFDTDGVSEIIAKVCQSMPDGGHLITCHWLGSSPDHVLHSTDVVQYLHSRDDQVTHRRRLARPTFVIDLWTTAPVPADNR